MARIEYYTQPFHGTRSRDLIRDRVLIPASIEGAEVTLVGAFATASGIALLRDAGITQVREAGGNVHIILGANLDEVTTREALAEAVEIADDVHIVRIRNRTFHAKIYAARFGTTGVVIDGSPNPTYSGLISNVERFVVITYDLEDQEDSVAFEAHAEQLALLTDPEALIEANTPLGLGGTDGDGLLGAVWALKTGGVIDQVRFRHSARAFASSGTASAARISTRQRRTSSSRSQAYWGLSAPGSGVPQGQASETDLLDFLEDEAPELAVAEQVGTEAETPEEVSSEESSTPPTTLVAAVTALLSDGGALTAAERSQALEVLFGQLEIQACNTGNPTNPYANPGGRTAGAFKRIAPNDLRTSSRASEIFIGTSSIDRLTYSLTPIVGQVVYGQLFYMLLVRPDSASSAIRPARTFHQGKETRSEIRLRTQFGTSFWDAGVAGGDFLCVLPVAEMDFHTVLAQQLEEADITPNLDDVPDAIGFVVSAEHHPDMHQRLTDALGANQISGYLQVPEQSDA